MAFKFHAPTTGRICTIAEMADEDICPITVGTKLNGIVRFQGQPKALTVAQHSILVLHLTGAEDTVLAQQALVHDIGEAFVGDYHSHFKLAGDREAELEIEKHLHKRGWAMADRRIKYYDEMSYQIERKMLWPAEFGVVDGWFLAPYRAAAESDAREWARWVEHFGAFAPKRKGVK